jgi:lipoprotein LpqH
VAKQQILVGIAAAATVAAGLAGCSSNKSGTSESSSNAPAAGGTSAPAPGGSKVIIDGQTQNVAGQATCTQVNGNLSIGIGDPTAGIGAVVTNADPPVVQAVGLGNLTGVTLGYSAGAQKQANAQATKSGNSYTIKGTATGISSPDQQQPVSKPFEIDVTCP